MSGRMGRRVSWDGGMSRCRGWGVRGRMSRRMGLSWERGMGRCRGWGVRWRMSGRMGPLGWDRVWVGVWLEYETVYEWACGSGSEYGSVLVSGCESRLASR